jgi:outer membrane protein assembly factor BamB
MAPVSPAPAGGKKRTWLIAAAAAALVVVIAAVAGIVYLLKPGGNDGVEFRSFVDVGTPVSMGKDETPYYTWTQLLDDRAYFAFQREDKRIEVIAAEARTGKVLWRKQSQGTSEEWGGITAVPGGVVVFAKSSLSDEPYDVSVWGAEDGRRLWGMPIFREDGVFFREDRLILVDRAQHRVAGFDLLTGSLKWQEKTPKDRFESAATAVYGVSTPDDLAGPADTLGRPFAPKADDDQRIVQVSADKSMRVIDASSGKITSTRTNVADKDDPAYAYDGRFVVATDAGVFSYDLDSTGQPAQIYTPADDEHVVTVIAPCGDGRVCLLETTSFDATTTELVAVDADKGGALWREKAAGMERLVPVGDHVLVSGDSPDYVVSLFDPAGKVVHTQLGVGMRVNGGSVLLLSKYLTPSVGDPSVAGLDVGAKEPTQLGPLTGVRTDSCSFDTEVIACAGETAFLVRRFANA